MKPNRPKNFYLILILGSLCALSPFAIDMYLPAFQKIAADFKVQVSDVSLSLSSYFIGLAGGQLIYGPLLDRFGRKPPLYAGLLIFVLASIGCMVSQNNEALIVFRLIQALGGCVAQVASIAMVRDFFDGKESAKIFSLLVLILGASPMLAPTIGSYLADAYGWQSIFAALMLIGIALMATIYFFLPEGHEPDHSQSLRFGPVFKNYASIFVNSKFVTYTFAGTFAFSGLFVYLASSPVVFLEIYKVSPQVYGWIFGLLAAGLIGASQANILFMRKWTSERILTSGMISLALTGFVLFVGSYYNWYRLEETVAVLFIFLSSAGVINPNASALALEPFSKNAGSASALMGSIQMGIGAIVSMGVGLIKTKSMFPFSIIFLSTALIALVILYFGKKQIAKS